MMDLNIHRADRQEGKLMQTGWSPTRKDCNLWLFFGDEGILQKLGPLSQSGMHVTSEKLKDNSGEAEELQA